MATSWTSALQRLAADVLDVASGRSSSVAETEQAHHRDVLWKLRLAFEAASEGGAVDELVLMVTRDLRGSRIALLAWFNLLEDIVQVAEQRFGTRAGQGEFKAAQAKAAVRWLLQRPGARSAVFVELLGPSAIDLVTGWCIDVIVELLNTTESLWKATTVSARLPLRTRILTRLVRWLSWLFDRLSPDLPLDPELYDAVERIAEGPGGPLMLLDQILELGDWVAHHRQQTVALVTLASTACDEVEYFTALRSSESKHRYARDLVIAALEDAGLVPSGAALDLEEAAISFSIDFVVATNNKRSRYQHRDR